MAVSARGRRTGRCKQRDAQNFLPGTSLRKKNGRQQKASRRVRASGSKKSKTRERRDSQGCVCDRQRPHACSDPQQIGIREEQEKSQRKGQGHQGPCQAQGCRILRTPVTQPVASCETHCRHQTQASGKESSQPHQERWSTEEAQQRKEAKVDEAKEESQGKEAKDRRRRPQEEAKAQEKEAERLEPDHG